MKQIADYAWISKTKRSWHLWIGNPFCVSKEIFPLKDATEKELIKFASLRMRKEKRRFAKLFPNVEWISK